MADQRDSKTRESASQGAGSIEDLLRERQKLDEQLKERFSQKITVMFTDIKGSTNFFETYGDIEGRLMVQKHNEMLFPCVEDNGGRVIKTIGDAIMAAFEEPVAAVRAATAMQLVLHDYNRTKTEKKDQIHVRIGINTGEGIVEKSDIFGDVVNVAARVESLTEPDEIMISGPVYEDVRKTDDILCRYAKQTKVKGKEEAIDVYRVIWSEEEALAGVTRGTPAAKLARRRRSMKRRLEIDISRDGETLKITASEKTDMGQSTIRPYEEMQVAMSKIHSRCDEVTELLNRANTRGKVSKDILNKMRDVGQVLFDDLLSAKAKETLRSSTVDDLVFYIEDTLVQIPWELLYDGEQFLCQKFNMGRLVKTRQNIVNIKQRVLSRPLKMLIVSDPRGDLENSSIEGRAIREQLDQNATFISANQRSGQITADYVTEKIRNFDIVHYAGHADYDKDDPSNSGWLLDGGKLTSADIMKLVGGRPMPALVFCNACQSGQTEEWQLGASYNQEIFGLANAFLLSGVQHYVGTFWEILDEPGKHFAIEFYRAMLEGAAIGEAMREARMSLVKEYGEDTIVWASYMLYGDPGFSYFDFAGDEEELDAEESGSRQHLGEAAHLRSTASETVSFDAPAAAGSNKKSFLAAGALIVALLAVALYFVRPGAGPDVSQDPYLSAYALLNAGKLEEARRGFEGLAADDPRRFEGLAAVLYDMGDFEAAREMSDKALETAPYNMYARVIQGNLLFNAGNLDGALESYEQAAERKGGPKWQKAEALNGIARIHSSRGDTARAAEFYARAAQLNPESSVIMSNQAWAMQRMGDSAGSLESFKKAAGANPGDPYAAAFLADALRKKEAEADQARRQRVDKLIDDLVESFKSGSVPPPPGDDWTSRPVTISFMNFTSKGAPAAREGEDDFFMLQLSSLLQESGRVQIVERELLDSLLEELKLSSTDLVDRTTSLRLGRVLSARVIATGSLMRYNGDTQISIRLTDTETTMLKGAVTGSDRNLDKLARSVAEKIVQRLNKGYPVRGLIDSLEDGQVLLNIGAAAGVQEGMQFKVLEETSSAGGRTRNRPVGTITAASVDQDFSYATAGDLEGIGKGMKVEQSFSAQSP